MDEEWVKKEDEQREMEKCTEVKMGRWCKVSAGVSVYLNFNTVWNKQENEQIEPINSYIKAYVLIPLIKLPDLKLNKI